jgi:hypothetical protein
MTSSYKSLPNYTLRIINLTHGVRGCQLQRLLQTNIQVLTQTYVFVCKCMSKCKINRHLS